MCICVESPFINCLASSHYCICSSHIYNKKCLAINHLCNCTVNNTRQCKVRKIDHPCNCLYSVNKICLAQINDHPCICTEQSKYYKYYHDTNIKSSSCCGSKKSRLLEEFFEDNQLYTIMNNKLCIAHPDKHNCVCINYIANNSKLVMIQPCLAITHKCACDILRKNKILKNIKCHSIIHKIIT